jgi:DNA repair protein RecO (recombination protein O)
MQKAKGIVLHHIPYSETSIVAHVFTLEFGFKSFMVKGARKPKAKIKKSIFLPLQELLLNFYPAKSDDGMSLLSAAQPINMNLYLGQDVIVSSLSFFIAEVSYKSLKNEQQNPFLYQFIRDFGQGLQDLDGSNYALIPNYFLVQLSSFLGFMVIGESSENSKYFDMEHGVFVPFKPKNDLFMSSGTSKLLLSLANSKLDGLKGISSTKTDRTDLTNQMLKYYGLHVAQFGKIKSLEVLQSVFQVM